MRAGKPSDYFQWRFKNEKEAGASFNGAVPPDLVRDGEGPHRRARYRLVLIPLPYAEGFVHPVPGAGSRTTFMGFSTATSTRQRASSLTRVSNYNRAFPGHQIAMPQPLTDGVVDYEDGTPNTLDQEAKDVVSFLAWAAEPHLVERKKLGLMVLAYLAVLAGLLFVAKKTLWRNVEH